MPQILTEEEVQRLESNPNNIIDGREFDAGFLGDSRNSLGVPQVSLEEQHPDLNIGDRVLRGAFLKNQKDEAAYLHKKGFQVEEESDGKLAVWKTGDKFRYRLDPNTGFFSSDFLGDAADLIGDTISAGVGTAAGTLAAPIPVPGSSLAAASAAAGATDAGMQILGGLLGIGDEELDLGYAATTSVAQATVPILGKLGVLGIKGAGKAARFIAGPAVKTGGMVVDAAGRTVAAASENLGPLGGEQSKSFINRAFQWMGEKLGGTEDDLAKILPEKYFNPMFEGESPRTLMRTLGRELNGVLDASDLSAMPLETYGPTAQKYLSRAGLPQKHPKGTYTFPALFSNTVAALDRLGSGIGKTYADMSRWVSPITTNKKLTAAKDALTALHAKVTTLGEKEAAATAKAELAAIGEYPTLETIWRTRRTLAEQGRIYSLNPQTIRSGHALYEAANRLSQIQDDIIAEALENAEKYSTGSGKIFGESFKENVLPWLKKHKAEDIFPDNNPIHTDTAKLLSAWKDANSIYSRLHDLPEMVSSDVGEKLFRSLGYKGMTPSPVISRAWFLFRYALKGQRPPWTRFVAYNAAKGYLTPEGAAQSVVEGLSETMPSFLPRSVSALRGMMPQLTTQIVLSPKITRATALTLRGMGTEELELEILNNSRNDEELNANAERVNDQLDELRFEWLNKVNRGGLQEAEEQIRQFMAMDPDMFLPGKLGFKTELDGKISPEEAPLALKMIQDDPTMSITKKSKYITEVNKFNSIQNLAAHYSGEEDTPLSQESVVTSTAKKVLNYAVDALTGATDVKADVPEYNLLDKKPVWGGKVMKVDREQNYYLGNKAFEHPANSPEAYKRWISSLDEMIPGSRRIENLKLGDISVDYKNLIASVIGAESNFGHHKNRLSKAGAIGIMQVMPQWVEDDDHLEILSQYGVSGIKGRKALKDDATNISVGTAILNDELNRFGRDIELALAAYNAGAPRVQKAIKEVGRQDFESIAHRLPKETQNYVRKIRKYVLLNQTTDRSAT